MTRRHFNALHKVLTEAKTYLADDSPVPMYRFLVHAIGDVCEDYNKKFDWNKWLDGLAGKED
jgi:hypothetical protein